MPELPEVETIRQVLDEMLSGTTITGVTLKKLRMLRGQSRNVFSQGLKGREIRRADRRGKFLLIRLDLRTLLVHLGMSGQIFVDADGAGALPIPAELPDKHTHLWLEVSSGMRVLFRDTRMFGRYALIDAATEKDLFSRMGPEPFDRRLTARVLHKLFEGRTAPIKALLLNQGIIAGVGNIYADESLFHAALDPRTPAGRLSRPQTDRLLRAVRKVLKAAVYAGGTSLSDFLDPRHRRGSFQLALNVYGRAGKPCLRCGRPITRGLVAQRGTHWCPQCQE